MDAGPAIALLQLELDLALPARAVKLIGDPSLVTEIQAEFDTSLQWLIDRLTDPGDEPVSVVDVMKLDFFIWSCMPADLIEGRPAAANLVEAHLDRVLRVVEGIVIDTAPEEP
ncbi:hypothetical protein [Nocardia asteroides]|uniref:hypothetical protein n=1 Tax=Nocardia asteroides TaxID=1824 RepID=UPI001E2D8D68|nr:hypothetical protein [Nocardia asteroides]UGT58882.1 hypothetical protein LTT85_32865 [Nocardia asteroides]